MQEMTSLERFLTACGNGVPDRVPFWIMRQVGRYDPDYRSIVDKHGFSESCKDAKVAAQLSLLPIQKLGFDAIIVFSDILFPAEAMGLDLEWGKGGPLFQNPIRTIADVEALSIPEVQRDLAYIPEMVSILAKKVGKTIPIIGFCGGAFTIAKYMTRESNVSSVVNIQRLLYTDPQTAHLLFSKLIGVLADLLNAQIEAGAHAGMVFDSWAGSVPLNLYEEFILPYQTKLLREVKKYDVPAILYQAGCCGILETMVRTGADVLGIDSKIDIGEAKKRVGKSVALQGNLDPYTLFASPASIEVAVRDCLRKAAPNGGYIFNTGEGLMRGVPYDGVAKTVAAVKKFGKYPIAT